MSRTDRARLVTRIAGPWLAAVALAASPVAAQEPQTRQADLLRQRQEKADSTSAPEPNRLEGLVQSIEDGSLLRTYLLAPNGFHLRFAGIANGGGFAAGPAYKAWRVLGGHADALAFVQASTKRYWAAEASLDFPRLASGRAFGRAYASTRYLAQEDYYGAGPASQLEDRVSFGYREAGYGGSVGVKPVSWLAVSGGVAWLDPDVRRGEDDRYPSIGETFDDTTAPGLAEQPAFNLYRASVDVDYAELRGNPRSGGRYRLTQTWYDDRDAGRYAFARTDLELWQYVGFMYDRRVLALHALVSTSTPRAGRTVPFYLQPTLGGSNSLRGFREFRFRDAHLLLLQAEYRWEIFSALDGAIFYDAGKVASRREDLDVHDLEQDWGFGFRFGTNRGVFLRIDSAFGSGEGARYYVKFGHVF